MPEPEQIEKFKEAAKKLGCDESEEAFDEKLRRIAKKPPPKDNKNEDKPGQ
jgi:hypothetical protein